MAVPESQRVSQYDHSHVKNGAAQVAILSCGVSDIALSDEILIVGQQLAERIYLDSLEDYNSGSGTSDRYPRRSYVL